MNAIGICRCMQVGKTLQMHVHMQTCSSEKDHLHVGGYKFGRLIALSQEVGYNCLGIFACKFMRIF